VRKDTVNKIQRKLWKRVHNTHGRKLGKRTRKNVEDVIKEEEKEGGNNVCAFQGKEKVQRFVWKL
jgi:hypothetical protein